MKQVLFLTSIFIFVFQNECFAGLGADSPGCKAVTKVDTVKNMKPEEFQKKFCLACHMVEATKADCMNQAFKVESRLNALVCLTTLGNILNTGLSVNRHIELKGQMPRVSTQKPL